METVRLSRERAPVKLIVTVLIMLISACSSGKSDGSRSLDFLAKKLEAIEHKKVTVSDVKRLNDQIRIPDDVSKSDFIEFFHSYLQMNKLIAITRGGEIQIKDMREYYARWMNDPDSALEIQAKTKKPLLIKFSGEDCHACKLQDRLFYSEDKLYRELDNFILLYVDGWEFLEKTGDKKFYKLNQALKDFKDQNLGSALPTIVLLAKNKSKILKGYDDRWDNNWGELKAFINEASKYEND